MVFHEGKKEVLAIAHHSMLGVIRQPDCIHFRFGRGTVHIHIVLAFLGFGAVFPSEWGCLRAQTCSGAKRLHFELPGSVNLKSGLPEEKINLSRLGVAALFGFCEL